MDSNTTKTTACGTQKDNFRGHTPTGEHDREILGPKTTLDESFTPPVEVKKKN